MKYNLITFFLLLNVTSFSQVEWRCVYNDTLFLRITEPTIQQIGSDSGKGDLLQHAIDSLVKKMVTGTIPTKRTRYVSAYTDSTLINIEPDNYLLKRGEIFILNRSGEPDSMVRAPRRIFKATGRQPIYFKKQCKEYISTDSACTIWVAEHLPACINPGIRVGDLKGAILYFQLKMGENMWIHCGIATIGKRI